MVKFDFQVTVRNPWGHNEQPSNPENSNTASATRTISLRKLVKLGGLLGFQASKAQSDIGIL